MVSFDMRTIILSFFLTYLVSTFVIFILWIQYHNRYKGTAHQVLNFSLQTLGLLLIVLRGRIPDWISVDLANTMIIAGFIAGYIGLEAYAGKKSNQLHNFILLAVFTFIHTWFTIVNPDLSARNLNISVTSLILFFQCAWLMLYRVPSKHISMTHPIGLVFVAFSLVSLANILKFIPGGKVMPLDYFDAGRFDSIVVILYHMLVILLTYSLVLMYSKNLLSDIRSEEEKRLLSNIEKEAEQQKYHELIRYERNLLRTLLDNLPDPVSVKDRSGHFLLINNALLEVIGAENQEEVIGKSIFDFLPGEEAQLCDNTDKQVLNTGKIILDRLESSFHIETGFPYHHLTSRIPIPDIEGKPSQLVTISHDITDKKRAEESHRDNAEFNISLLNTIPFGMDIVDEEGTILFMNDNFREIFGTDAVGKKCWEVYRIDKKQCMNCPLTKGIGNGKTEKYESHGVLGERVFDIYHTGMKYQGRKALLEIFHDITDHKNSEDLLIRSKEKAEESDRLKTAFLQNVSHEIRTPLNAIVGFTTLLGEPGISPENHRSYLEIVTQSSDHLLSIVTDIIEISNLEAGKMKLDMSKVNINSTLEILYKQFKQIAVNKGLEFKHETSVSGKEEYIYTDNTKLLQVLSNLLANAIKFTREGYIKFGHERYTDRIEFYVSDSGIGIPNDQQVKVFERFYQVDSSQNREYEGTGLGLSLSKAYVELLGGKIRINSEVGKGSTFFVSLPC